VGLLLERPEIEKVAREALAADAGPSRTPEHTPRSHFKLQNSVNKRFVRVKLMPNLEFKDHRAASLA
jgi:hypothetical protein